MKKRFLKIALIVTTILIALIFSIYAAYGGFRRINFALENSGGEWFVYKSITGHYSQGSLVMDSIYYLLLDSLNISTTKGAGIYYDNPESVEDHSTLRSDVGSFLNFVPDSALIESINQYLDVKELPVSRYLVTSFPIKGSLSYMIGVIKIYRSLDKYLKKYGYQINSPITEIYDIENSIIIYRVEIAGT